MYKFIWALSKSKSIIVNDQGSEWTQIKDAVKKKVKDIDPKILTNILVLSTVGREESPDDKGGRIDLFQTIESDVILMMKAMSLTDLVNLLWSA